MKAVDDLHMNGIKGFASEIKAAKKHTNVILLNPVPL
jgi:hypothetical protein